MKSIIEAAFDRSRTVLVALVLIVVWGAYVTGKIPKEAEPDVQLPLVYVSMFHEGISPEDAERLLVRVVERELQSLEGLKEMRSTASEGHASVLLEFDAGTNIDKALQDVRDKVDLAKVDFPDDTDEPIVDEVNLSLFPVLVVTLAGDLPERALIRTARDLKDRLEALPDVLEVDIAGDREEVVEIIVDPLKLESFGLKLDDVLSIVGRNNQLVAAGAWDVGRGRFAVKVPGVFEDEADILRMPVKVEGDRVVTLTDVATVRRTFKDPEGFARVDGRPALALEVKKRIGRNIIETIEQVQAVVDEERPRWPASLTVGYSQDKSNEIRGMLRDLGNNVISAVVLTMIITVAMLGLRSSLLVGLAVPFSFLAGMLVLHTMGLTVNIVVLFALILAVGMLVDGSTVVVEYADRKMAEGQSPRDAYRHAATRMFWPVTASTATVLAAFLPMLFWPGITGEFMQYLPITLVATLVASLVMAMIFVPVLGAMFGRPDRSETQSHDLVATESGDMSNLHGLLGVYVRSLRAALKHPTLVVLGGLGVLVLSWWAYAAFGRGVEFFPSVEPEQAQVLVHARGDRSVVERDALVREVEARIAGVPGIERMYARTALTWQGGEDAEEDVVGQILLEFTDWRHRPTGSAIMATIRERTADLAGIRVETKVPRAGPPVGKPVQLEVASRDPAKLDAAVDKVRSYFDSSPGLKDVADTRPIPGIEWRIKVDREQASRFGADIASVGSTVRLVTNGIKIGTYRPDDAEDEVDIVARFPVDSRNLDELDRLVVNTAKGSVPLSQLVTRTAEPRSGSILRVDGRRAFTVTADVEPGVLPDTKVAETKAWLAAQPVDPDVFYTFRGEDEEQQEAQAFLGEAFVLALFLIAIILLTQFNSFYQVALILTAVIYSTVGVFLGLLIVDQPFGIIMSGIGVIALAGIVVSNNIVLIDTYNELRARGMEPMEAVLRTGAQRLRPVLLTTFNGVLGLLPLVFKMNIDLIGREVTVGGPSADWWQQLSLAIAWGLTFATLITLVLTPCLLLLGARFHVWLTARRARRALPEQMATAPAE
ncbi:MAG: efflux RND transporter permease subunit [Geminicoccaceae bacterium]